MDQVEANTISECRFTSSRFLVFHCSYFVWMYFLEGEVYSGEFIFILFILLNGLCLKNSRHFCSPVEDSVFLLFLCFIHGI